LFRGEQKGPVARSEVSGRVDFSALPARPATALERFIGGAFHVTGASGNAELAIPLSGPRAKGTIYVVVTESAGEWNFSTLVFQLDSSGARINLQEKNQESPR
jgi:Cytochrome oxidase complex assembly protein 1